MGSEFNFRWLEELITSKSNKASYVSHDAQVGIYISSSLIWNRQKIDDLPSMILEHDSIMNAATISINFFCVLIYLESY